MSLSAEALAQLEGLDLQEARDGLNFSAAAEGRQSAGADLSSEELAGLRSWDLSGVIARLNSLTFEPPPAPMPEPDAGDAEIPRAAEAPGAVTHAADEGELPDWLKPAEEAASPAGAGPPAEETAGPAPLPEEQPAAPGQRPPVEAPSPSPREQWNQSPDNQRDIDLGEWYRKLKAGEPIEDWQKQALKDFNVWGGGGPLPPAETAEPGLGGPTAEEAAAGLAAAEAAGAGTQVFHEGEMVIPPARREESRKQLSDWLSKVDWKRIVLEGVEILGPAVFSAGLYEAFPQLRNGMVAVASTAFGLGALTEAVAGGILMAEKRFPRLARLAKLAGYVRGKGYLTMQLSASALAGMTVTDIVHYFQLHAAQAGAGGVEIGATGGLPSDERGGITSGAQVIPESPDVSELRGQPPGEQVGQEHRWGEPPEYAQRGWQAPEAPAASGEPSWGQPPGYEETLRQAALQLGPTVAELAAQMPKQTVSEAIYQMIGDVPHRGEVTNILFRAIGDKVNSLNQGAIKAAAEALRPVFDNIDKVMADSGTAYTEGGRAVVETKSGFNSPEAQAIRAANMGDLEAAGNLLNNVIGPVIK